MNAEKQKVCAAVDLIENKIRSVAQTLFEHPEVKFEEYEASRLIARELESAGFRVELGVAGLETAIRAVHPQVEEGPTVAIIGEYDALPELGHACGHNLIAGAALGAALAVGSVKHKLVGRLIFFGTPAEEGGGGKVSMVNAGAFDGVDAAMMIHPSNKTIVERGSLAFTQLLVEFTGRAAHASGYPEKGINALDAVIQTFASINALRQHIKDGARIHGIITHGGTKPNIVPDYAAAEFNVRAADTKYRDEILAKTRACAEGAALATGARLSFSLMGHQYKSMKTNRILSDLLTGNLESIGEPLVPPMDDALGSTDMGDVSQVVPSIHAYVKICEPDVVEHTPPFATAASSERGQAVMIRAAKAMAMTAVDILQDLSLSDQMWREHRSG